MRTVAIIAFDEVEALDFAGPFEVFTTANRVARKLSLPEPFKVYSVATQEHIVVRAGIHITVDKVIPSGEMPDVLIVPGGVTSDAEKDQSLLEWIVLASESAEVVASVCTGAFLLATAGLVDGLEVTTHWEDVSELRKRFPDLVVRDGERWVDQGKFVTSAGISAGIDMALHLVERLESSELATATARQMDYHWSY
jgi:transcriptional regulator GlxA family with amidase domain